MSSKISILMAVYNAAPYLCESIESIRRQTFKEWELIAIDDASTDDSRAILSNYAEADPRIRLISLPHNGGQGKARNEGLRQAQGDYICFVDSDDCLAPTPCKRLWIALRRSLRRIVSFSALSFGMLMADESPILCRIHTTRRVELLSLTV